MTPPSTDVICAWSLEPDELLLDVADGDDEGERDPGAADVLDQLVDADAEHEAVPLNAQHPEIDREICCSHLNSDLLGKV